MTSMEISVVIPAKNEIDNVEPLIREIMAALDASVEFEIVYVDDGSSDGTHAELLRLVEAGNARIKPARHRFSVGQSTAIMTGVRVARGELIVTMDADGQNDPADIPALVRRMNGEIVVVEVNHRDRRTGISKYDMLGRLGVGIIDMFGVMWLQRRAKIAESVDEQ